MEATTEAKLVDKSKAQLELAKFFELFGTGTTDMKMPGGIIDEVWHEMLNQPEEYKTFSFSHADQLVCHKPMKGKGQLEWVNDYHKSYGELSEAWFSNENGVVDLEAYNSYKKTGIVVMEWDCAPVTTDDKFK